MNEQMKEQLSAFLDGEVADEDTVISSLIRDGSMKAAWHRYNIISDVIHRRSPLQADIGLASRIAASIRDEPTVLSPEPEKKMPAYLKPVAGLAIAASVATLAILGIQSYQSGVTPAGTGQPGIARAPQPAAAPGVRVSGTAPAAAEQARTRPPARVAIQSNPRISRYLLNHNEFQAGASVQGAIPYVRLVATDAGR